MKSLAFSAVILALGGLAACGNVSQKAADGGPGGADDGGSVDAMPGACDLDGDGFMAEGDCGGEDCDDMNPDRYPGSPPICGNGESETCPGVDIPAVFEETAVRGILPPTDVLAEPDGYLPELAMAATDFAGGGFGQAFLFAMESTGEGEHRPVRFDVPLGEIEGGSRGPLLAAGSGDDLTAVAAVTSVDARTFAGGTEIGVIFTNADGTDKYRGLLDLAAGTSELNHSTANTVLDEPAVVNHVEIVRRPGPPAELNGVTFATSPAVADFVDTGVPAATRVRMVSSDSPGTGGMVMLQDEDGGFWFWGMLSFGFTPLTTDTQTDQSGKAAFAYVQGDTYVVVFEQGGDAVFVPYDCVSDSGCEAQPSLEARARVPLGPAGGEVPDAHALPDGRVLAAMTERHNDGDRLVLQILDASLFDITTSRFAVLDLRGTGERVTDARIDIVEADEGLTAVVAATVRDGDSGDAQRVVLTGLRACNED